MGNWKKLAGRVPYATEWFSIEEHDVLRPDGTPGRYSYMEVRPSVGVVAVNARDEIAMVGQWRYPAGRYLWEIVRGGSDLGESDMLAVAQRELREEAGVEADRWESLGSAYTCTGLTTDCQHFFVATGLRDVGAAFDPAEPLDLRWVPLEEALRLVTSNEVQDVCSLAAILKYRFLREKRA